MYWLDILNMWNKTHLLGACSLAWIRALSYYAKACEARGRGFKSHQARHYTFTSPLDLWWTESKPYLHLGDIYLRLIFIITNYNIIKESYLALIQVNRRYNTLIWYYNAYSTDYPRTTIHHRTDIIYVPQGWVNYTVFCDQLEWNLYFLPHHYLFDQSKTTTPGSNEDVT